MTLWSTTTTPTNDNDARREMDGYHEVAFFFSFGIFLFISGFVFGFILSVILVWG